MIYDVAVIGLGIIGQVAVDELSKSEVKVIAIDNLEKNSQNSFLRDIDGGKKVWSKGSRIDGFPGGRINWGRNCSFVTLNDYPPLNGINSTNISKYGKRLRKYGFPHINYKQLSVSFPDKFYVKESKEFNKNQWISKIKTFEKLTLFSGKVVRVIPKPDKSLNLLVVKTPKNEKIIIAKKILICTGAIGSHELLVNSDLMVDRMPRVFDHLSMNIGDIPLKTTSLAKFGLFGWNRYSSLNFKTCFTFPDKHSNVLWTLRVFPKNVLRLNQLSKHLVSLLREYEFSKVVKYLSIYLVSILTGKLLHKSIGIHISVDFLNRDEVINTASYSEKSRIEFMEYDNFKITYSNELKEFVMETLMNLKLNLPKKLQIYDLLTFDFATAESASHHMGTIANCFEKSESFSSRIGQNIWVAGGSIFQNTLPGHPTMFGAATALMAIDEILADFVEK